MLSVRATRSLSGTLGCEPLEVLRLFLEDVVAHLARKLAVLHRLLPQLLKALDPGNLLGGCRLNVLLLGPAVLLGGHACRLHGE